MLDLIDAADAAHPVFVVPKPGLERWLTGQPAPVRNWLGERAAKLGVDSATLLPGADGHPAGALAVVGESPDLWAIAGLPGQLPAGHWRLDLAALDAGVRDASALALGWALGTYRFGRYLKPKEEPRPRLVWPDGADRARVAATAEAIQFVRDLINTPAQDMGPASLELAARSVAERFGGTASVVTGDDLLAQNFPMIHAVGRAADEAPRLIDLRFDKAGGRKVTLVGKGVCFDTGGLDLKPASGMELMRKDMGGAATVLGLAQLLLAAGPALSLRVLIPAVENAVAGNAYRPGDILSSRKGLTVEIGNTDAEGRLILADALTLAGEASPDLLIDVATLTGAARVAVGPEIAAYFARDDGLADALEDAARTAADPVWRLPLHDGYRHMLDTPFADINNSGSGRFAGATTAALFLEAFVEHPARWMHLDVMAWNDRKRPGRPKGGEAMALRALHRMIEERFGHS